MTQALALLRPLMAMPDAVIAECKERHSPAVSICLTAANRTPWSAANECLPIVEQMLEAALDFAVSRPAAAAVCAPALHLLVLKQLTLGHAASRDASISQQNRQSGSHADWAAKAGCAVQALTTRMAALQACASGLDSGAAAATISVSLAALLPTATLLLLVSTLTTELHVSCRGPATFATQMQQHTLITMERPLPILCRFMSASCSGAHTQPPWQPPCSMQSNCWRSASA